MRTWCSPICSLVPIAAMLLAHGVSVRALAAQAAAPARPGAAPAAPSPAPASPPSATLPAAPPAPPPEGAAPAPAGAADPAMRQPPPPAYAPYPYAYPPPGIPLTPPTLPYVEGQRIPFGYRLEERSNKPLIVTGLSLFGLAYALSLGVGLVVVTAGGSDSEEFAPLIVPLAGPFIAIGTLPEASATMTLNGITQTAGLLMTAIGIFATEQLLVRVDGQVASATPEFLIGPGTAGVRWQF